MKPIVLLGRLFDNPKQCPKCREAPAQRTHSTAGRVCCCGMCFTGSIGVPCKDCPWTRVGSPDVRD